jgi:class 3 adenylate cyclase
VDRVLATILFTDIVDSTHHAAEIGDTQWRRLLDKHDEISRSEISRFRGRPVKGTGDGFLATFDGPARAIRAATAIEERVAEIGIEVRAGIHAGEIELRHDDIGGIGVHIAARVAAEAGPGEVLVSRTVRDLVAGSGIVFAERGTYALKGVSEDWDLYAVAGGVG